MDFPQPRFDQFTGLIRKLRLMPEVLTLNGPRPLAIRELAAPRESVAPLLTKWLRSAGPGLLATLPCPSVDMLLCLAFPSKFNAIQMRSKRRQGQPPGKTLRPQERPMPPGAMYTTMEFSG